MQLVTDQSYHIRIFGSVTAKVINDDSGKSIAAGMKRKRLFHDHLHEYPNEQQDDFACDQQGRIISDNLVNFLLPYSVCLRLRHSAAICNHVQVGMASAEVDFSNNLRYNLSKMVDDEEDSVREAVIVRCCLTAKMDYLTQLQTPVIIISANESERKQLEEMIEGLESHAGLRALTLDDFLQDDTADASIQHKIVLMNPLANVEELSAFKSAAEDGCVLLGMAFGCHVDRSAWTFHDEYIAHTRDRLNGSIATAVLASFTNRGLIDSMLSDPLQLTAVELAATLANLKATMDAHPEQVRQGIF